MIYHFKEDNMTHIKQDMIDFAKRAAKNFEEHPEYSTFTDGEVEAGCLFGVRWGLGDDCVLVFELDYNDPVIFTQFIKKKDE